MCREGDDLNNGQYTHTDTGIKDQCNNKEYNNQTQHLIKLTSTESINIKAKKVSEHSSIGQGFSPEQLVNTTGKNDSVK